MAWQKSISKNATVGDTVNLIIETINKYSHSPFVAELSKKLNPTGNKLAFMQRLFNYACESVNYKRDPIGHEKVTTPERLIRDGIGDCKKFTVLIASVLKHVGIEPICKVISYDGEKWEHIYVIANYEGKQIVLDPVNDCKWNTEIPHKKGILYFLNGKNMELSLLGKKKQNKKFNLNINGVSGSMDNDLGCVSGTKTDDQIIDEIFAEHALSGGVGKIAILKKVQDKVQKKVEQVKEKGQDVKKKVQDIKTEAKKDAKKVVQGAKKVGLAPARLAFLTFVRLNFLKVATKLAQAYKKDPARVKAEWTKIGGDEATLKKEIEKGAKVGLNGMGAVPLPDPATITAGATILTVFVKMFKDLGIFDKKKTPEQEAAEAQAVIDQGASELQKIGEESGGDGDGGGGGDGSKTSFFDIGEGSYIKTFAKLCFVFGVLKTMILHTTGYLPEVLCIVSFITIIYIQKSKSKKYEIQP